MTGMTVLRQVVPLGIFCLRNSVHATAAAIKKDQMMLNNLKIGQRLGAAFALMILLVCAVGGVGLYQAGRINAGALELGTNWLPSIKVLGDLRAEANAGRIATLRNVLEITPEGKAAQAAVRDKVFKEKVPAILEAYSKMVSSPEEQKLYDDIKVKLEQFKAIDDKIISLSNGGDSELAQARKLATSDAAQTFLTLSGVIEQDVELNEKGGVDETQKAGNTYRSAITILLGLMGAAVASASFLAWIIVRSITRPVEQAVLITKAVAAGDLTSNIAVKGNDEIAQLLGFLTEMNGNLARIVGQVRASSDSIATGSAQIATGNADLSQRTEEQASNLQQTAASMEQISGTVKTSADTAGQANRLAASASAAAIKGGEMMGEVVNTMHDISAASKKIADIIGVIDGIAFQTNILALNAAVEAARAGEQGRGFAVVASEVRSLAGRSAEAAKEIKSLIGASVERVEAGTRQVNDAGTSMGEIVSQVQRVSQMIEELSKAAQEQSSGVGQIGQAVQQLDQVTQQNAALVEESAAAAESLKHQAAALAEVVSVFKVAGGNQMAAASSYSSPTPANAGIVERRNTNRATNVTRPKFQGKAHAKSRPVTAIAKTAGQTAKTGTDNWETF